MADTCKMAYGILVDAVRHLLAEVRTNTARAAALLSDAVTLEDNATQLRRCRSVLIKAEDPDFEGPVELLTAAIDDAVARAVDIRKRRDPHTLAAARAQSKADAHQRAADLLKGSDPIIAVVNVVPTRVRPSDTITLNGSKFAPGIQVTCQFVTGPAGTTDGTIVDTITVVADAGGMFSRSYTVKNKQAKGTYHWSFVAKAYEVPDVTVTVI